MPKLSATTIASPVYQAAIAVNIPTYPPAWDNPTFPIIAPTPSRKNVIHSNRNVMNNPREETEYSRVNGNENIHLA